MAIPRYASRDKKKLNSFADPIVTCLLIVYKLTYLCLGITRSMGRCQWFPSIAKIGLIRYISGLISKRKFLQVTVYLYFLF